MTLPPGKARWMLFHSTCPGHIMGCTPQRPLHFYFTSWFFLTKLITASS